MVRLIQLIILLIVLLNFSTIFNMVLGYVAGIIISSWFKPVGRFQKTLLKKLKEEHCSSDEEGSTSAGQKDFFAEEDVMKHLDSIGLGNIHLHSDDEEYLQDIWDRLRKKK
nr:U4 protein [Sophora yellow stunt virus]